MKFDPHGYGGRLQSMVEKVESGHYGILEENQKLIIGFYRDLAVEGLSTARVYKVLV